MPDIALGAITAACIAAALSFLGLIASKELKTSEFRQAWIDAVRDDIAIFVAAMSKLTGFYANGKKDAFPAEQQKCFEDMNLSVGRLKLRLNPEEQLTNDLMAAIAEMGVHMGHARDKEDGALAEFHQATNEMAAVSARLLKREWNRVKAGEPIFRISKWLALVVALVGIALVIKQVLT